MDQRRGARSARSGSQCRAPIHRLDSSGHQGVERPLAAEGGGGVPCGRGTGAGGDPEGAHVTLALDVDAPQARLEAHVRRLEGEARQSVIDSGQEFHQK